MYHTWPLANNHPPRVCAQALGAKASEAETPIAEVIALGVDPACCHSFFVEASKERRSIFDEEGL